jgi:hypothetical protein
VNLKRQVTTDRGKQQRALRVCEIWWLIAIDGATALAQALGFMRCPPAIVLVLFASALALAPSRCLGDRLFHVDGTIIEGNVTKETDDDITIETKYGSLIYQKIDLSRVMRDGVVNVAPTTGPAEVKPKDYSTMIPPGPVDPFRPPQIPPIVQLAARGVIPPQETPRPPMPEHTPAATPRQATAPDPASGAISLSADLNALKAKVDEEKARRAGVAPPAPPATVPATHAASAGAAPPILTDSDGVLYRVSGTVKVTRGGVPQPVTGDYQLKSGDAVAVRSGKARIALRGGISLRLPAESSITIRSVASANTGTVIGLMEGGVWAEVPKGFAVANLNVQAKELLVTVTATTDAAAVFRTAITQSGDVRASSLGGPVVMRSAKSGESTAIPASMTTIYDSKSDSFSTARPILPSDTQEFGGL